MAKIIKYMCFFSALFFKLSKYEVLDFMRFNNEVCLIRIFSFVVLYILILKVLIPVRLLFQICNLNMKKG